MPDQITLVPEGLRALGTLVCLLLGYRRHIVGVVVKILVPLQQLLLSESLVTFITTEWLLVRMNQHVRLKMTLRDGRIWTQVTLEAFLSFMALDMHLVCVAVWEGFATPLAF